MNGAAPWFLLAPLLVMGFACTAADKFASRAVVPGDFNSPGIATLDRSPVLLMTERQYGRTTYRIPRAYLSGRELWNGGTHDIIAIETAFPAMIPWSEFGEQLFAVLARDNKKVLDEDPRAFRTAFDYAYFDQWVSMRVRYGHCFGLSKGQEQWLRTEAVRDSSYDHALFDRYRISPVGGRPSMYVPKKQSSPPIYIQCPDLGGHLRRCSALSELNELVSYEFWFLMERLQEFQEINDKVRALLQSFIIENRPSDKLPSSCTTRN